MLTDSRRICLCCQESLLSVLHHHLAYGEPEETCIEPHCLTHQLLSMRISEQVIHALLLLLLLDNYCEL